MRGELGSPEQVFAWTPSRSGTATVATCGSATTFDTVVYLRSTDCADEDGDTRELPLTLLKRVAPAE